MESTSRTSGRPSRAIRRSSNIIRRHHPSRRPSRTAPRLPGVDDLIKREIEAVEQVEALPGNLTSRLGQRIRSVGVILDNQPVFCERTQRRGQHTVADAINPLTNLPEAQRPVQRVTSFSSLRDGHAAAKTLK